MKRIASLLFFLMACVQLTAAQSRLDSLKRVLEQAPVQEKVYIHMDNTCYFKGDTIWYKAYVVRADNNQYTDMSRLMYVELVSPDGLVVERQQLIVSEKGYSSGDFALKDSLYSGFYELRAYTRWMLNFCVTEHPYGRKDREQFYNRQMAADFFRQYGTIYSRVFPVYERPDSAGDYSQKYIVSRPKQRLDKEPQPRLNVRFYPEGGSLIAGSRCRIAFEATTEEGEAVSDLQLQIGSQTARTEYMGRGALEMEIPEDGTLPKVRCTYKGKEYSFSLPKAEKRGVAVAGGSEDGASWKFTAAGRGLDTGKEYGCAVLCRGQLRYFQRIVLKDGGEETEIALPPLPTGVNDFIVFDEEGMPLADRLFFVDNHDYGTERIEVEGLKDGYQPYEQVRLAFHAPADAGHLSISVRDASTDDPTYDTGNMMTELLLSSELKGFVAYPDYYFEADDEEHRRNLDLLMMVQGWRRYDFREMTENKPLRYQPEKSMTVEGAVYKMVLFNEVRPDELPNWRNGIFGMSAANIEMMDKEDPDNNKIIHDTENASLADDQQDIHEKSINTQEQDKWNRDQIESNRMENMKGTGHYIGDTGQQVYADNNHGINHGGLHKEVVLESELVLGTDVATVEMQTRNGGQFEFSFPPFYGDAILFMSAHNINITEKKAHKLSHKDRLDEHAFPEYYVKRNLFFPVFAKKYSYFQCNFPDYIQEKNTPEANGEYSEILSSMDKELETVDVKTRRRKGKRAIDYDKPVAVYNAYEIYNLATDYGLSFGMFNIARFPIQIGTLFFGSLHPERSINVDAKVNKGFFYRSYTSSQQIPLTNKSNQALMKDLELKRLKEIRVFTDFELRNWDKPWNAGVEEADVTVAYVTFPDGGKQYTFRDRRIVLHGLTEPSEFYCPDYSRKPLPEIKDYRRTLYWNPNAKLDSEGNFKVEFYNGSREVRMKVCAEGLTAKGNPIINQ